MKIEKLWLIKLVLWSIGVMAVTIQSSHADCAVKGTENEKPQLRMTMQNVLQFLESKGKINVPSGWTRDQVMKIPSMAPEIVVDTCKRLWQVTSWRLNGTTHEAGCRMVNGCSIRETLTVVVSDQTGVILEERKTSQFIANYE